MINTTWYEVVAVITGIASVWYSKNANILVYPVGLISTIIYVYLSLDGHLIGEASVNFYYSVMSIYGWMLWSKKNSQQHLLIHISWSSRKEWVQQISFFLFFYIVIFFALTYLKKQFY